jgi:hypothetical protein
MLTLALSLALTAPALAREDDFDHSHARWTAVLERHVSGDRFDYLALARERTALDGYLAELHRVTPSQLAGWTREERFAFWINTYNAHVVDLVCRNWPLESIKDLGGLFSPVWKKRYIDMPALDPGGQGRALSLDDVEHQILRPRFRDARVHAAVNCASIGCPPLRAEAFVAERLSEQLDDQTRKWLADSRRNRYERSRSTVHVSKIFDWFEEDFERDAGGVEAWIRRYAPAAEAEWMKAAKKLKRKYVDYDWAVNVAPKARN